jgi:flagellar protein FliS
MDPSPPQGYLRHAVLTATPEQLQLMLYDGAIRFCLQAREALGRKDFEAVNDRLTRAQNIILEMKSGLNYEINDELCRRIASIYNFLYRKLIDANIRHDTHEIDDALRVLRVERETWRLLVDKVGRARQVQSDAGTAAECEAGFTARV